MFRHETDHRDPGKHDHDAHQAGRIAAEQRLVDEIPRQKGQIE